MIDFIDASSPLTCAGIRDLGIGIDDLQSFANAFAVAQDCPAVGLGGGIDVLAGSFVPDIVVDVESTPIESSTPTVQEVQIEPSSGGGEQPMALLDDLLFSSIGGGVEFPSLSGSVDPLSSLIQGGLGLASDFLESPTSSPTQLPSQGTLSVNTQACAVARTSSGKLVRTHLRKEPVKARKSIAQACVTNRHMNSLNPHALRRATRRLNGFMHHVKSAEKAIHNALGRSLPKTHHRSSRSPRCGSCGRSSRSCVC